MLTISDVQGAVPPKLRGSITQEMVDTVNQITTDPEAARTIRENIVSYTSILADGKFKLEDYLNAVAFVSFKVMGYTNRESYSRTFPARYSGLVARGASDKDISAYVSSYSKNKLVNLILEQTLIPTWVLNQDAYQKAINVQVDLMLNANSEKVRSDAANSILTHLKQPEKKEVQINLGIAENSGLNELRDTLTKLAEQQQTLISGGKTTREIAHQPLIRTGIIDAEAVDVTPVSQSRGDTP